MVDNWVVMKGAIEVGAKVVAKGNERVLSKVGLMA